MVYGLQKLDVDCKVMICAFLDPVSLARLSCTCRDWHATSVKDHLWQQIAQDRWRFINCTYTSCVSIQGHNPQAASKGAATQHDWHRLYARNNQWNTSQLQKSQFQTPGSVYDFSMSRTPRTATNLDTCDSDNKVYILQVDSLHIWDPSGNVLPSSFTLSATYDKLIETAPGIVAATRQRLNDHIDILPVLEATDGCTLQARSTLPGTIWYVTHVFCCACASNCFYVSSGTVHLSYIALDERSVLPLGIREEATFMGNHVTEAHQQQSCAATFYTLGLSVAVAWLWTCSIVQGSRCCMPCMDSGQVALSPKLSEAGYAAGTWQQNAVQQPCMSFLSSMSSHVSASQIKMLQPMSL